MNTIPPEVVSFINFVENFLQEENKALILQKKPCFKSTEDGICVGTNQELNDWLFDLMFLFCENMRKTKHYRPNNYVCELMIEMSVEHNLPLEMDEIIKRSNAMHQGHLHYDRTEKHNNPIQKPQHLTNVWTEMSPSLDFSREWSWEYAELIERECTWID